MLFDSPVYLASLTLVALVYWRLGHNGQNNFLLAFSYFFYGWWDWRFLGLIALSTIIDYHLAQAIERNSDQRIRRLLAAASIGLNLLFLGFFKYFNFFVDSLHAALGSIGMDVEKTSLNILLPPGISFYTFQAIAYIVDVYARRIPASRSLRDYALFICLFPHLIAGPIQRPQHLLSQVERQRQLRWKQLSDGLLLIASGLFRKCVVAGHCALIANAAFGGGMGPPSLPVVLLGTYAFAWQIYGDFSGYSNIARGSAQLLGFHFMVNFRQPYSAQTLQDFWRRWHISLSTWLRDYLYIPLGGNRQGSVRTYRNLLLTMVLGGLWHGANWTYVIWGGIHGAVLSLERALGIGGDQSGKVSRLRAWLHRIAVFHIVCLAWVFFRAESVSEAVQFLGGLGTVAWSADFTVLAALVAILASVMIVIDAAEQRRGEETLGTNGRFAMRMSVLIAMVGATLLFSANSLDAFIYFQF
jgi:alginate O-acetyltransferase complex protein AlgI